MLTTTLILRSASFSCLTAAALLSPAQVTRVGGNFRFMRKFTQGQVIRYSETFQFGESSKGPSQPSAFFTLKVIHVKKNVGDLRIEQTLHAGSAMEEKRLSQGRIDAKGNVVGADLNINIGCTLPEKSIKVGGKWNALVDVGVGNTFHASATFRGVQVLGGREVALADLDISSSKHPEVKGTGEVQILLEDGALYHLTLISTQARGAIKRTNRISIERK